jgi:hypothetical protein
MEIGKEYEIIKQFLQTSSVENNYYEDCYIILKDGKTWYGYYDFGRRVIVNDSKINLSDDAYIYICYNEIPFDPVYYYYPLMTDTELLVRSYLSKRGFYSDVKNERGGVVPAIGLKYLVRTYKILGSKDVVVEFTDIEIMGKNVNLPSLVPGIPRYMNDEEVFEISEQLALQRVFNGFSFVEAEHIIRDYDILNVKSYAKYVEDIKHSYRQVFQPYRKIYRFNTK